jgi:hypothetical protein
LLELNFPITLPPLPLFPTVTPPPPTLMNKNGLWPIDAY